MTIWIATKGEHSALISSDHELADWQRAGYEVTEYIPAAPAREVVEAMDAYLRGENNLGVGSWIRLNDVIGALRAALGGGS